MTTESRRMTSEGSEDMKSITQVARDVLAVLPHLSILVLRTFFAFYFVLDLRAFLALLPTTSCVIQFSCKL